MLVKAAEMSAFSPARTSTVPEPERGGHPTLETTALSRLVHVPLQVVEEARPRVLGIFAIRFLAGALISGGVLLDTRTLRALAAWVLLVVAVYVLNGYQDVAGDRLNGSSRPIASGRLPAPTALRSVLIAGAAALGIAATVSVNFLGHVAAALALGAAYSVGKWATSTSPLACTITVVSGGLLTYHAGLLASGGTVSAEYLCFSLAMSMWMAVGGLVKDLTDVTGDSASGRRTIAVVRGGGTALTLATVIAVVIAGALLLASVFLTGLLWPAVVLATGMSVLAVEAIRWRRIQSDQGEKRPYRAFMLTQYAAHVGLV